MADTSFAVSAGSGTNLHTVTTSIGGSTVHDQVVKHGDAHLATYTFSALSVSTATGNSHILQIMAGSTLNVYLRRLQIYQSNPATTATIVIWDLLRLTTAGTGGGAVTANPFDTTDAAAGATGMTLSTVQGTEGARLHRFSSQVIQTIGASGTGSNPIMVEYTWDGLRTKAPRIAAGTSNGLVIKNVGAVAAATVHVVATIVEANH